jgi:hypothetical protein
MAAPIVIKAATRSLQGMSARAVPTAANWRLTVETNAVKPAGRGGGDPPWSIILEAYTR